MASSPIISWQIEGEKVEAVTDFLSLGSKSTAVGQGSLHSLNVGRRITLLSFYTSVSLYHFHCVLFAHSCTWHPILR